MNSFPVQPTQNCHYCANQFDIAHRVPYIICSNSHQICLQCLNSLRSPDYCRVCRFPIDFNKIRPNKELVQILTSPKSVSYRQQPQGILYQQNNQVPAGQISYKTENARVGAYSAYKDIDTGGVGLQNYPAIPPPAQENIAHNRDHYNYKDQSCQRDCFQFFFNSQEKILFIFFYIQVAISIVNFLIAENAQRCDCLDNTQLSRQISFRKQLFITFYTDLAIVSAMLFGFILYRLRCMQKKCFITYLRILLGCSVLKLLIWGVLLRLNIFQDDSRLCNGGLYGWHMVTTNFYKFTAGVILFFLGIFLLLFGR